MPMHNCGSENIKKNSSAIGYTHQLCYAVEKFIKVVINAFSLLTEKSFPIYRLLLAFAAFMAGNEV